MNIHNLDLFSRCFCTFYHGIHHHEKTIIWGIFIFIFSTTEEANLRQGSLTSWWFQSYSSNLFHSQTSPTGPTFHGPRKNLSIKKTRRVAIYLVRGLLVIQFLMDSSTSFHGTILCSDDWEPHRFYGPLEVGFGFYIPLSAPNKNAKNFPKHSRYRYIHLHLDDLV